MREDILLRHLTFNKCSRQLLCYSFLIQLDAYAYLCGVLQSRTLMEPWVQVSFNKPGFADFQTELNYTYLKVKKVWLTGVFPVILAGLVM